MLCLLLVTPLCLLPAKVSFRSLLRGFVLSKIEVGGASQLKRLEEEELDGDGVGGT